MVVWEGGNGLKPDVGVRRGSGEPPHNCYRCKGFLDAHPYSTVR